MFLIFKSNQIIESLNVLFRDLHALCIHYLILFDNKAQKLRSILSLILVHLQNILLKLC